METSKVWFCIFTGDAPIITLLTASYDKMTFTDGFGFQTSRFNFDFWWIFCALVRHAAGVIKINRCIGFMPWQFQILLLRDGGCWWYWSWIQQSNLKSGLIEFICCFTSSFRRTFTSYWLSFDGCFSNDKILSLSRSYKKNVLYFKLKKVKLFLGGWIWRFVFLSWHKRGISKKKINKLRTKKHWSCPKISQLVHHIKPIGCSNLKVN